MLEIDVFQDLLQTDDDPELWQVVLCTILKDDEFPIGFRMEVGSCSHWLRPHQSRWTAAGGFAWPTGYGSGSGGYSLVGTPQYDWSLLLGWNGASWEATKRDSKKVSLRIAIPSRTKLHQQAAVNTIWAIGREKQLRFYGFRKLEHEWSCVAVSDIQ